MYVLCDNLLYKLLTFHLSIVPQLKTIASNLRTRTIIYRNNNLSTTQDNIIFSQPKSGARKAEWISAIANYFHLHRASANQLNTILNGTNTNSGSTSSLVAGGAAAATKRKKKSPAKKRKSPTILSDEAMARSLQNRFMQEDSIGQLLSNSALPIMGMSNGWGNQAYGGGYSSHLPINAGASLLSAAATANGSDNAELKMPAKTTVKVKTEPTSSASSTDILLQPRDFRESNMVSNLRGMGFTDTTEILTALRAVAAQREEVSIISAATSHNNAGNGSNGWSSQEQTEAAMMWIVQQREEVEEAKKLDEARISSEQADMATEHSRKQTMELELKNSDMVSLLGSVDNDIEIRSKHFPYSALLCDQSVKRVLSIASSDSSGKDQVIRLLNLEKKARKWYGTVLPFSYFSYCLRPRIECLLSAESNVICQKLSNESDIIEKAMFTLTEQVEGGLGRVPRIFFDAQQEAFKQGKPTASPDDSKMAGNDDDIRVVEQTMQPRSNSKATGKPKMEVIEIT